MKATRTKKRINNKTKRGIFAWFTLVLCITALIVCIVYSIKFLGASIVVDAIVEFYTPTTMTDKVQSDLIYHQNVQKDCLIIFLKCIPLYVLTFFSVFIWKDYSKKFISSLFFN